MRIPKDQPLPRDRENLPYQARVKASIKRTTRFTLVFEGPVSGPQKDRNWTGPRPQSGLFFGPVFDI